MKNKAEMTKLDPIITVKDKRASSLWHQQVFGCKSNHEGNHFDILTLEDEVLICLHQWGEHEHPSMQDSSITPGNGLILYLRVENMEEVRQNVKEMNYSVETEIHLNPNSHNKEFSLRDPNEYCWIVSEFHKYGG